MDEQLLFCVSINCVKKRIYGPEWKEMDGTKTLIDLFLQVCGTEILGQQVQVLVSKERSFLEAAMVPVSTPLIMLAEKSQSYIQYLLKCENKKIEKLLQTQSHKSVQEKSLIRHETFRVKSSSLKTSDEGTSYYGLTGKIPFEDMTVEEICEEIRRIRTSDLSRTNITLMSETTGEPLSGEKEKLNKTPPVIKKMSSVTSKKTRSPTPTLTSRLRSLKSKAVVSSTTSSLKKSNQDCTKQGGSSVTKKPNSSVPVGVGFTRNNSSIRTLSKSTEATVIDTVRKSIATDPPNMMTVTTTKLTKSPTNISTTEVNTISIQAQSPIPINKVPDAILQTNSKSQKCRGPNVERLSVLAKPRRRHSEPSPETLATKTSPKKVANCSQKSFHTKKLSTSITSSPKINKAKSLFVKPSIKNLPDTTDYFVEIFAKETKCDKKNTVSDAHEDTKQEYSSDSLLTHSTESSEISMNNILNELREKSCSSNNISQKDINSEMNENELNNQTSEKQEKSLETIDTSIENSTSGWTGNISPQKSPLFTSLLEKNNMKHCSSPSLNGSLEKDLNNGVVITNGVNIRDVSPDDVILGNGLSVNKLNDESDVSMNSYKYVNTSDCISVEFGMSSEDVVIDSLSLSTSSKNNDVVLHQLDNQNGPTKNGDLAWSNSRGIKFLGSKKHTDNNISNGVVLNETYVIAGEKKDKEIDESQKAKGKIIADVTIEKLPLAFSSPYPSSNGNLSADLKHARKHWDNSLKGMDELLITSLKAFSMELRSTTEIIAANIKTLYEDWQKENEGTDEEESVICTKAANGRENKLASNKISPPPEEAGIQKGIAFVFRNLRKIEIKLKTIEQATVTMMKKGHNYRQENEDETVKSNENSKQTLLSRNKSFKWKELKNSARIQAKTSTWRQSHPQNDQHHDGQDTSSEDSDS